MKKLAIAAALLAAVSGFSFAASVPLAATLVEVAGKVEYQLPGKDWKAAKKGDVIPKGTVVSTGFKSSAVIKVGPATITVKPVTRMALEDLVQSDSGTQTQLFLQTGRVKADVTPQSGQTAEFKVKSPTATASVRGTGFEFDGVNLLVDKGVVQLRTPTGMVRYVGRGEFSYVSSSGTVSPPVAVAVETGLDRIDELVDQADVESQGGLPPVAQGTVPTPTPAEDPTGGVTVILE